MEEERKPSIDADQETAKSREGSNNVLEQLKLRESSLILNKFDETMPPSLLDSKKSIHGIQTGPLKPHHATSPSKPKSELKTKPMLGHELEPTTGAPELLGMIKMTSSSVHHQSKNSNQSLRRGSWDERMRQSSVGQALLFTSENKVGCDDRTDWKQNLKSHEASPKLSLGLTNEGTSSILHELTSRKRYMMVVAISICGFVFITGCMLTVVCFSISSSRLIPGQIIGVVMFAGGGGGCIFVAIALSQPDKELQRKIKRREKLFSTFKEIAYRNEERRYSSSLNDKLPSRMNPNDATSNDRKMLVSK